MSELNRRKENFEKYYENYKKLKEKEEYGKAGEMIWGAVSNLIEAISWARSEEGLGDYSSKQEFIKQLSGEMNDEDLFDTFEDANDLHVRSFYERRMSKKRFLELTDRIERILIPKLKHYYNIMKGRGEY
ncbi:hypothetical protein AKJ62_00770 [candidate division MSBL1 archaeon SCGC-AAA259D14]|uniref:Uncharacterized protein n=2 Tax=candidate division MSBL1 TaxID=215777 RepID=A0A133U8F6_9EURY|nr:hypothetical protein AKJ62_00770 [candidate division MSBL1 archaeon SCGC-AAA259D14]KXA93256.1 hypothetical protein AKJ66_02460 [candidate division MSBL1 archaeon SCGC-AAA259E22]